MIKKKLGAIVLATTMILSLVGCSKKNFDGNYTAEVDFTDYLVASFEAEVGSSDYEWKGSFVIPYQLELADGEYNLTVDASATEESFRTFMSDNIEDYLYVVLETDEDDLAEAGFSSIWEVMGYSEKDAFIEEMMGEFDVEELGENESGEYEIDGDVITLNGVEIVDEDGEEGEGWPLTYEDGNLTGILDMSDLDIDEDLEVTFVRDED
jgi:hypothetical protein